MQGGNDRGKCHCGHSYKVHLHKIDKVEFEKKDLPNREAEEEMKSAQSKAEQKRIFIDGQERMRQELHDEKETVIRAGALFAMYLKQKSTFAFNDYTIEYLELELRKAEALPENSQAIAKLKKVS